MGAGPPKERTKASVARALGVTPQAVGAWMSGVSRPEEGRMRELVTALTGIPADAWTLGSERAEHAIRLDRLRRGEAA